MRIASALAVLLLAWLVVASGQQPTPVSPDPQLTPGDAFEVGVSDLCVPGYTKSVRNVPAELKRQVYAEYGVTVHGPGAYEVDHLVPLELGGSNSIKNLWPESKLTRPWNALVKDRLENKLHELVCAGKLNLKVAQAAIATNWIQAYQTYVGPQPSTRRRRTVTREVAAPPPPAEAGQVWVNTKSGKYWQPGTRYYGKTRQGEYMDEAEARAKGYSPAQGSGR